MNKIILNKENEILRAAEDCTYAHIVQNDMNTYWEPCTEEIAREDYANRTFSETEYKDGGILFPMEKLVMPFGCGADRIVEAEIPEGINVQEYKYIDGEFVINAKARANNIKQELEKLDTTINRATEDLYVATGTAAYANVQEVIDRKNALRAELASLEA